MPQDPFLTKKSLAGVVERVSLTPPPTIFGKFDSNAECSLEFVPYYFKNDVNNSNEVFADLLTELRKYPITDLSLREQIIQEYFWTKQFNFAFILEDENTGDILRIGGCYIPIDCIIVSNNVTLFFNLPYVVLNNDMEFQSCSIAPTIMQIPNLHLEEFLSYFTIQIQLPETDYSHLTGYYPYK